MSKGLQVCTGAKIINLLILSWLTGRHSAATDKLASKTNENASQTTSTEWSPQTGQS